ncbi:MAG: hypothetical protein B7Y39_09835 [Bdellovibrio sp. 28-41-41]|nr:MAG: hypothetical protein B7Y39_09835 [Bdellovibrio sp. 28-41-41]
MKNKLKILGILAALVVIIFGVMVYVGVQAGKHRNAYQAKVTQIEAKTVLLQVFISQRSFWAEFGIYTSSVMGGGSSTPVQLSRYKFGFTKVLETDEKIKKAILVSFPEFDPTKIDSDSLGLKPMHPNIPDIGFQKIASEYGCVATATTFKACAVGYPGDDGKVDVWTIQDNKQIVNVKSAIE